MAPANASELLAAVQRLTGDSGAQRNHIYMCCMRVESSDGQRCGINVRVSLKTFYKNSLNQVADMFRVEHAEIGDVLDNWTTERLRAHLEQFPAWVLKPPATARRYREFLAGGVGP